VAIVIPSESLARFERLSFVSRLPARAGLGGEHRSRRRAPSTEFVEYRPYQPGDDFRRVDWNVYGRLGSLQVRVTEGRERLELILALDCSASMAWGEPDKLAFAARTVAALAYVGLGRFDAVRLVQLGYPKGSLGPLRGRRRFGEVVQALSDGGAHGRLDLSGQVAASLKPSTSSRQALVVLVSDLLAPDGVEAGLDGLLHQGVDVVVLHVLSPQELNPDLLGELELLDAETNERLEVGLSLAVLKQYRERLAGWLERQASACSERGLRYVRLRSDRPLDAVMLDDLRRGDVLR
jgi:uncharacterized protein (DUF58 family)